MSAESQDVGLGGAKRRKTELARTRRLAEEKQREVIKEVKQNVDRIHFKANFENIEYEVIENSLERLNENFDGITTTTVARDDAQVFTELSSAYSKSIERTVFENRRLNVVSFLSYLKNTFGKGENEQNRADIDWARIGRENNHLFNGICRTRFFYASLDVKPRKRKTRGNQGSRNDKRQIEEVRPQDIDTQAENDTPASRSSKRERDHHKKMQSTISNLVKEKPGGMLETLINPRSFTQSVENIFEYSFLVKDYSIIEIDDSGKPNIRHDIRLAGASDGDACPSSQDGSRSGPPFQEHQSVLSFDMKDWYQARKIFRKNKPQMPHREDAIYKS